MNLGDVSSIFAPIQPAEEVTPDTENLKPLLEPAEESTTTDEDSAAVAGDPPKPANAETANAESGSTPFAEPASAKEAASEAPQDEPVDTPFKPVALTPTDSSSSPFAKGGPAGLSQRTELPPKKAITAPADQRSPFEPGEAPSFESSPAATTQSPAEGTFEPADSSPFSTIGSPPSEPSASVSASPSPTATPAPAPAPAPVGSGDSDDQDKVDELLRQFKERYGRK
jgi:hypothetical protein